MEFLPKSPIFDEFLYSEQMHELLSDDAKAARAIANPPRRRFDRQKFLDAMDEAFDVIGGVRRLSIWADKNPTEFFKLMGKTIPQAQLLDIQAKMAMQIIPPLPPSPLDGEIYDAVSHQGGVTEPLRESLHGERGGAPILPGPEAASGGGVQHVPPKASGEEAA